LFAAGVLAVAKIAIAPLLVDEGWKGVYWTSADWKQTTQTLRRATFLTERGVRPYRLDRSIDYRPINFGLYFINDRPPRTAEYLSSPRDQHFPLVVHWSGYVIGGRPDASLVTANGTVRIAVGNRVVLAATNPRSVPVRLFTSSNPSAQIVIDYNKPPDVAPAISISPLPGRIVPAATSPQRLAQSDRAAGAIGVLGILIFITLAIGFTDAYPRMSVLALEHVWLAPMKVGALAFFIAFTVVGIYIAIPERHSTIVLGLGDDPLTYEGQARLILQQGILMTDRIGNGDAYYHYPFYSYALAAAHFLFGEDFSTVKLFNYICIASLGFFVWGLLRNRVAEGAGLATLALVVLYARAYLLNYATTSFTDNLYVPMVLAVLCASTAALTTDRPRYLWLTGVLAALASATRPSFLLYVPCFMLALLFRSEIGSMTRRLRSGAIFGFGFGCGVMPFTIRNWIVSRKFVLLVESFVMLPIFLYAPEETATGFMIGGRPPGLTQSLAQFFHVWATRPVDTAWVELRKLLFTFGLTWFGPSGSHWTKYLWIYPLLFILALALRRVPRHLRDAMIIFAVSHIVAMVLAAPWTYGYKTILPLHLVFLIGAAFLLPRWGEAREIIPAIVTRKAIANPVVSVVLPTYNEKDSIRQSIRDFFASGIVDEVLVINNNAVPGTSEEVAGTGAREIFEPRQGYGAAIRRGLAEARGDYIIVCEPDGTFLARDAHKLLAYAQDFDVVYGSRTSQQLVWRGANMGAFLRWGNWAVAKYLEFLYNATSLTDVGCTYRLIRRDVALALMNQFRIDGNQFGPEMMILTLRAGYRVIQVPINYMPRVGVSSVTGDPAKAFLLGLQMMWLITSRKFEHLFAPPPAEPELARAAEVTHGEV
jgi:hypothetical protein